MDRELARRRLCGCYVTIPTLFRDGDLAIDLPAIRRRAAPAERAPLVVVPVHLRREAQLTKLADALDAPRARPAARQRRQQQTRKHAEHGDDDEQFKQRESTRHNADAATGNGLVRCRKCSAVAMKTPVRHG